MTAATAVPRFGSDLMELVLQVGRCHAHVGCLLQRVSSNFGCCPTARCEQGIGALVEWLILNFKRSSACQILPMSWTTGYRILFVAIQVELARLGGAYRGYSRGLLDAEHRLKGQYSLLGHLSWNRKKLIWSGVCLLAACRPTSYAQMIHLWNSLNTLWNWGGPWPDHKSNGRRVVGTNAERCIGYCTWM